MSALKTTLTVIGTLLLLWFLLPIPLFGVINTGNYIGTAIASAFLCYGLFFEKINCFIALSFKPILGKIILTFLSLILLFMFVFAVVVSVNIAVKANNRPKENTTVVVLGCRVRKNGPSLMLSTRLNAAYNYLSENPDLNCILSGGKGEDEPMSEGQYMYNWLVDKGIDPKRLYVEDRSTSTEENLEFSKKIIEENSLESKITIITNDFHQYRAYRFAAEKGFESYSYSAKTPILLFPTYYIREICGVAHMIFIGTD